MNGSKIIIDSSPEKSKVAPMKKTFRSLDTPSVVRYLGARIVAQPEAAPPAAQRVPFGWRVATVAADEPGKAPLTLAWPDLPADAKPTRFRLTVGLDERDEKTVEVFLPTSRRVVGTMELRFVSQFQVYELVLTPADVADIKREGLALRLTAGSNLETFVGGANLPDTFLPHLLVPGASDPTQEFFARMNSLACVQQFGWMEGCVLDGLLDLSERPQYSFMKEAAQRHLDLFFQGKRLVYESPRSAPIDGTVYGIEGTLPFAALARLHPEHPALELALKFWLAHRDADGVIIDGQNTTSEGAYTIGYPLALLGRARRVDEWERLALTQLKVRQERFFDGKEFWRTRSAEGHRTNRNWARGIAWQILGMARTLAVLKERKEAQELIPAFVQLSKWVCGYQRSDGLWSVFVDEMMLTPDTAGSAGIAAALAIGVRNGWLTADARRNAERTREGLKKHLTPDGFLGGVSQSNKGGEGLQRGSYRSIYQMGMGLQAQLIAALEK